MIRFTTSLLYTWAPQARARWGSTCYTCKVRFCAANVRRRSINASFREKMSSASGGFTPQTFNGAKPLDLAGDFRLSDPFIAPPL